MKILSVGSLSGLSNTCLHRNWALKKIADQLDEVNTSVRPLSLFGRIRYHLFFLGIPVRIPENNHENTIIKELVSSKEYDLIWIDKGLTIFPETLEYIKENSPKSKIISYSPDNMALRHNQSQQYLECLPLYDYIVTNKSYIVKELQQLGAKNVVFVNNTFEETFHHPYELTDKDVKELGGEVGFVGTWEKERCESIMYLANHGIKVKVFGSGKWKDYQSYSENLIIEPKVLKGEDYCKALQAFKISLCFLRKMNFDVQTTRTIEIPACGGFLMAERTEEHMALFKEGVEAEFFCSNEELLNKCKYYLSNEKNRIAIVKAGYKRCHESNYTNTGMIRSVVERVFSDSHSG